MGDVFAGIIGFVCAVVVFVAVGVATCSLTTGIVWLTFKLWGIDIEGFTA